MSVSGQIIEGVSWRPDEHLWALRSHAWPTTVALFPFPSLSLPIRSIFPFPTLFYLKPSPEKCVHIWVTVDAASPVFLLLKCDPKRAQTAVHVSGEAEVYPAWCQWDIFLLNRQKTERLTDSWMMCEHVKGILTRTCRLKHHMITGGILINNDSRFLN